MLNRLRRAWARQPAALRGCIPEPKPLDALPRQAAALNVVHHLGRILQALGEDLLRPGVDLEEIALRRPPSGDGRRRRAFQCDPCSIGQHAQRLGKINVFDILHEIKNVPPRSATPALVRLAFGIQLEGRIVVVVKRTERLVLAYPTRRNGRYSPTKATISIAFLMADLVVSE